MRKASIFSIAMFGLGLLLLFIFPALSRATAESDQAIVDSFYPPELLKQLVTSGQSLDKISCFVRLDGSTIVAGYSNNFLGAVLLLTLQRSGNYQKTFQVSGFDLKGTNCAVIPIDLSSLLQGQVLVRFGSARVSTMDWVFEVMNNNLVSIGPTRVGRKGIKETLLASAQVLNFYRDGNLQLTSGPDYPPPADDAPPPSGAALYRVRGGVLNKDSNNSLLFVADSNDILDNTPLVGNFAIPSNTTGPFFLRVVNGDQYGENSCSNGTILLNGKTAASFIPKDAVQLIKVDLQAKNTIEVQTQCESAAKFLIAIASVAEAGRMRGDLNNDGQVDKNDLALINDALNTEAVGTDDPRDLNHDGKIDALDARILVTLCTYAGCATQ